MISKASHAPSALHQKQLWSDLYDEAARNAALLELSLPWLEAIDSDVTADDEQCVNLFRLQLEVTGTTRGEQLASLLKVLEGLAVEVRDESARTPRPQTPVDAQWLQSLPIQTLRSRGILADTRDPVELQQQALALFDAADVSAWNAVWQPVTVMFRRSAQVAEKLGSIATWLRLGELAAQRVDVARYDPSEFRATLDQLLHRSRDAVEIYVPEIQTRCAAAGVAVVFVPEIPGAGVHAVARVLPNERPLIQLGLRYRSDDLLWFNLMHEAAHILLHTDNLQQCNLEDRDAHESEANAFAQNLLIPPESAERLGGLRSLEDVKQFAAEIGVADGIVVGRLQHDGLWPYRAGNELKRRLAWQFVEDHALVREVRPS